MSPTSAGERLFNVLLLLLFLFFIITSLGYKFPAKVVPLIVAIPGFFLTLLASVFTFGKGKKKEEPNIRFKVILEIWLWLIGWVVLSFFVGFLISSLLFLLLFLKIFSRKSWFLSIVTSVILFFSVYIIFHALLGKL